MSSIYITSRLHSAWADRARLWAQEMRNVTSRTNGNFELAPPPSSLQPPPEEFGDILRAILPFINHGINNVTASAIIASHTASIGVSPESFLPLAYYSGLPSTTLRDTPVYLAFERNWIGIPMVPIENFPFSRLFSEEDMPINIAPFPTSTFGKVLFSSYHGRNLWLTRFNRASELTDRETEHNVHPRELARVPASSGLLLREVITNLRYTGCIRPPTPEELENVFANIVRPDSWMRSPEHSFRDFFSGMGLNERTLSEALDETQRLSAADSVRAGASSTTDVPAILSSGSTRVPIVTPDGLPIRTVRTSRRSMSAAQASSGARVSGNGVPQRITPYPEPPAVFVDEVDASPQDFSWTSSATTPVSIGLPPTVAAAQEYRSNPSPRNP